LHKVFQNLLSKIFRCITGYLKSKTVILVTHQIQFVQKASKILVLKEGKPLAFGAYDELIESGIDFMSLIKEDKPEKETKSQEMVAEDFLIAEQFIRPRTISVLSKNSEVIKKKFGIKIFFFKIKFSIKG
jgi:ABC-type multidrug transport system ATPase subunit